RALKITIQGLRRYLRSSSVPYFDSLLHFCYALSTTPLAFLTEHTIPPQGMRHFIVDQLPLVSRGKGKHVTPDDVLQMRQIIETLLRKKEIDPSPSLKEIAQCLGYDVRTIRKFCPDLCRASVMRYKRQRNRSNARIEMQQALKNALACSERPPLTA